MYKFNSFLVMPIENLGKNHFTDEQILVVDDAFTTIMSTVLGMTENLTSIERRNLGKVGEKNKLIINKVKDYHDTQPNLQSPDVDWEEFEKDYADRRIAEGMLSKIRSLENLVMNIKILRDHDNYADALRDYKFAQYKSRFGNQSGYQFKIEDIQPLFPKTGKTKK